ncbi:pre-mRNA-splicing factor SYF2, putative [Entamoeba dispar SAW760]|uniref:Pre-mRNA-splicing factor SYF2 n=1 Tax=Entamoeba dispar (strain ATCC PRA-260 / SAW760) TaxID=370354 RepID=B0EDI5_ENTDS|nr:pre-mRNA-splicing factor SYF2, putative [Entamoeba dispar SAW760]EDR27411.1 pre-mRNA-splicing factor SYF2, putative [Entamoeba dispar SAW760]|eukprot:EDR27411.1 pre-mRNA-splicing factor SYF2, putative [Entamoeba dispar SAW760]
MSSKLKSLDEMIEIDYKHEMDNQKVDHKKPKLPMKESSDSWMDVPANTFKHKKDIKDQNRDLAKQAYSAYEKKIHWLNQKDTQKSYQQYKQNDELRQKIQSGYVSPERIDCLQKQLARGKKEAQKFHRERKEKSFQKDYINSNNKKFNEHVNHAYDQYTSDIKDALEH